MLQLIFKVTYNELNCSKVHYFEFQQSKHKLPLNVCRLSFPFQMLAVTRNTDYFDLILVDEEVVLAVEVESVQSLSILSRRR